MATVAEPVLADEAGGGVGSSLGRGLDETGCCAPGAGSGSLSTGLSRIRADAWDEEGRRRSSTVGPLELTDRRPPDSTLAAEHRGLVHPLVDEGVDVVVARPMDDAFTKAVYVRDPLVTVPGGAIVAGWRAQRRARRPTLARRRGAGMPVLGTMTGTAMLEGESFAWLRDGVAALVPRSAATMRVPMCCATCRGAWIGWELFVVLAAREDDHSTCTCRCWMSISRSRTLTGLPYMLLKRAWARWASTLAAREAWGRPGAEPARSRAAPRLMAEGSPGDDPAPARRRRRGADRRVMMKIDWNGGAWKLLDDGSWSATRLRRSPRTRPRCPGR